MNLSPSLVVTPVPEKSDQALRKAAEKLEATFIAEMLKSAGLGTAAEGFGGGAGEEHFSSFLVEQHAMALVQAGGIGLTESIFEALKERQNDIPN